MSCSWVIVVRRYVLILLRAEKERSDEALVVDITSNSFMTVHTDENATLAAEERPPRM